MADERDKNQEPKQRRSNSEAADNRAASCKAKKEKQRADRLERLSNINLAGDMYYRQHIHDYAKIGAKIAEKNGRKEPLSPSQVKKYLKKFADTVQSKYRGEFKSIIDKIIATTMLSSEEIEGYRHDQLAILLNSQIHKGEDGKLNYSADPEKIAQIRLLLDSIREDKKNLVELLGRLGAISGNGSTDDSDVLFEIRARRAKVITNNSNPDNADNGKT